MEVAAPADVQATLKRNASFYVVQPSDSLWSIAKRLLGPNASPARVAREVNRLWSLNRDRIATGDPDLLMVGTRLELAVKGTGGAVGVRPLRRRESSPIP